MILIRTTPKLKSRRQTHYQNLLSLIREFELGYNLSRKPNPEELKKIKKQVFEIVKRLSNT